MAKAGASPDLLAKAVQLQKALADKGVPTEMIAEALSELLLEAGALDIPGMYFKKFRQNTRIWNKSSLHH